MADANDTTPSVTPSDAAPVTSAPVVTEAVTSEQTLAAAETALNDKLSKVFDSLNPKEPSKAAPVTEAAPSAESETPSSDQPANAGPEPTQSSSAIAAPNSWSAEAKAEWVKLPPATQAYIAQRESEIHKAFTQAGQQLKAYVEPLQPVYQALNQHWGVPQGREAEVIHSWARAQHALDTNPVEALKWLAQSYNVDLSSLAGQGKTAAGAPQGEPSVDDLFKDPRIDQQVLPVVQALQKQIAEQNQALRQLYGTQQSREQAESQRAHKHASGVIQTFKSDKPYFDELEDTITTEVRLLKQSDPELPPDKVLEIAYDNAVWKTKSVRERILQDQRKAEEAKSKQETAKKQADAKKLSSMNVRSGSPAPSTTMAGKFMDDDKLSAIYDRVNAG